MSFLRKLFGGGAPAPADSGPPVSQQELDEDERRYERELADFEQHRIDELRERQLRYADRAWTPPAQGGDQRADDGSAETDR